ncbi:Scr1 family TA system antitoxin-like transcriptional regulator [Streptomyces antibioticus]|uniref:helix-turn-helix domain-containing protein n=1 Tax=Streptomyces antibioticus TaxID=1890 RepID=UPI00225419D6|nr:helix-turn-helix transcriptional regulator [Streptomyces antibioticus]MCX5168823.1 helix-turn-helix domain-containing protein [Streptomyces antibioticus]
MAVSGEPESSDSLRTFGAVVQGLREHHGLSREELGDVVGFSKHTVASVELGRRMPDEEFVEAAELVLGNTGALRRAAGFVERQAGLADWFQRWARMERVAISLFNYECRMIPGLLQTEAYARQLFGDELPPLNDEEIETAWAARAERQQLLLEMPNTAFSFVIEEHAFLRRTGGPATTRGAIEHILGIGELRHIEIQVVPLVQESHAGLHGPIALLETPKHKWFGYSEGQASGTFVSDPKAISVLQARYARMRGQALAPRDSVSLLERILGDL